MEVNGFESRDVGIVLNVTPHVNDANEILVELEPEISSLGSYIEFGSDQKAPSFDVTMAKTQVLIRDRETIAIGGLVKKQDVISETKIPLLGDIPFIGRAFRSKTQNGPNDSNAGFRETLFFITCTIVDTVGQPEFEDEEI